MQKTPIKLLDVVALLEDQPEGGLVSGQVGTVVEVHSPEAFDVEFLDANGQTIAVTELRRKELLVLRNEPALTA